MQNLPAQSNDLTIRPPKNLLLSTDLSCRCDRALDRAVSCSEAWGAHLTALTVVDREAVEESGLEGITSGDPVQRARRRLRRDTSSLEPLPSILVRSGDVLEQLLDVASGNEMELVVTGVARNQWFRAVILGSVVDGIIRNLQIPALVVKNRVIGPYRRILVAGDLSPLTEQLLRVTAAWFPDSDIALFHAFGVPYLDLADANRELVCEQAKRAANQEAAEFLNSLDLNPSRRFPVRVVCEYGMPVPALNAYSERSEVDLVVIGNQGHGVFMEILKGNTAKEILLNVESDVLVIPEGGLGKKEGE